MLDIEVTFEVLTNTIGWFKLDAAENILLIVMRLEASIVMGWLKLHAPWNIPIVEVTLEKSKWIG